jgi:S-adenosylmethionine:tRNA ribosyltransferase-isomerase
MQLDDFYYELPQALIAQEPLKERSASRLLALNARYGEIQDKYFKELPNLLTDRDLLVFNNTKVIPARLLGRKPSGGRVEVLLERIVETHEAIVQIRASGRILPGATILVAAEERLTVLGRQDELFRVQSEYSPFLNLVQECGHTPLPPYISRPDNNSDRDRYQSILAKIDGSVAAPTASLHFDQTLLDQLDARGVGRCELTLHIGAGTFEPVREKNVAAHKMHSEYTEVSSGVCESVLRTRSRGGRVIAVGTTSLRSLESSAKLAAGQVTMSPFTGETDLFILPGYEFKVVDGLITNFHLPKSTLLMLVSAFSTRDIILRAYQHAIRQGYRFYSYGDAMFIDRSRGVALDIK